jgi:ribosomal-protein-alanine N-acetyltransferase
MPPPNENSQPVPNPAISIRAAHLNDLPAILALEQTAQSAAHWTADHYQSRLQSQPQSACFLVAERQSAESNSQLCGFLCARIIGTVPAGTASVAEWEIENVVVLQECRRRGIGAALMRALIEEWQEHAGAAVLLEVRESNHAARALYERHGLRETGRRRAYYRDPSEDAILYARYRQP